MATGYAASGREMTVGGVMGRAFGAIGAAPLRFLGTSLLFSVVPATASKLISQGYAPIQPGANPAEVFASRPWGLLVGWWIVYFGLYLLAKAILIRTTAAVEDGAPTESFGETVAAALRALLPLLVATILCYLAIWVGLILLIVPGVILALVWAVTGPALVLERVGIVAAFGRSARLTKGARLRILGLYLVVFAVYVVLLFAMGLGAGLGFGATAFVQPSLLSQALGILVGAGFVTVWNAIQASLYLALRDWKDGASGEQLADIFA
jgi:hypothetical protein